MNCISNWSSIWCRSSGINVKFIKFLLIDNDFDAFERLNRQSQSIVDLYRGIDVYDLLFHLNFNHFIRKMRHCSDGLNVYNPRDQSQLTANDSIRFERRKMKNTLKKKKEKSKIYSTNWLLPSKFLIIIFWSALLVVHSDVYQIKFDITC